MFSSLCAILLCEQNSCVIVDFDVKQNGVYVIIFILLLLKINLTYWHWYWYKYCFHYYHDNKCDYYYHYYHNYFIHVILLLLIVIIFFFFFFWGGGGRIQMIRTVSEADMGFPMSQLRMRVVAEYVHDGYEPWARKREKFSNIILLREKWLHACVMNCESKICKLERSMWNILYNKADTETGNYTYKTSTGMPGGPQS